MTGNYDISYVFKAIDEFSPALKKINEAMSNFEKQTEKSQKKFKNFSNTVEKTGMFLTKWLVLPLAGAAIYAIKNAEQFNAMQIRLESVAGSAANAAKIMESVKAMSMATGLKPEELADTATRLMAAGYGIDQINGKLQQMSMFAVVSGKNVNEIAQGFVRMKTVGYAQSRFMARMAQQRIPLIQAFKQYYHLSDKAWMSLASKGIDFKLIEPVLDSMTKKGSAFYESYRKMLMTTGTSADRIHAALRFMAADFGEALMNAFGVDDKMKSIADKLAEFEPKLKKWLAENPELLKMGTYIAGISSGMILAAGAVNTVIKAIGILTATFSTLSTVALPILSMILAIKGVDFKSFFLSTASSINKLTSGDVAGAYKTMSGGIINLAGSAMNAQEKTINQVGNITGLNAPKASSGGVYEVLMKSRQTSVPLTMAGSGNAVGNAVFDLDLLGPSSMARI